MARPHSTRSHSHTRIGEVHNRKQCLQVKGLPGLHYDLCRRPPIHEYKASSTHCSAEFKRKFCLDTGDLTVGSTIHFLGRNISHRGDHIDISWNSNYVDIILEESGMTTCNPAPSPGVSHMNGTAEDEAPLDHEQHKRYRRLVGKIQWLAYTRPDISYGAKELARSLQAPTQFDNNQAHDQVPQGHKVHATQLATKDTNTGQANTTQH